MKKPALTVLGALVSLTGAPATILLNEIHINPPPDADLNYEYVELRSSTDGVEACIDNEGRPLTLLIIENNGGQVGEVEEAINLDGLSTGENGLLIIGSGYDGAPGGGPWSGFKAAATASADPAGTPPHSGLSDDDIDPNGGLTFLLVSGWSAMTNASSTSLGDVDVNNNMILDWLEATKPPLSQVTQPFTTLIDSIGFQDRANVPIRLPYTTPAADLSLRLGSAATFAPDNISRRQSRAAPADQSNAAAWYGGNLVPPSADSIVYDLQFFGDFKGQATPGQVNLNAPPVAGSFLINEVVINPSGSEDGNFEFIEIINTVVNNGSLAASLQGYALVKIGSSADPNNLASQGKILDAWDLGAMSTGANGLLLLGNDYPTGRLPWGKFVDPLTQLGDPSAPQGSTRYSDLGDDDIGSNNGFTLLLVRNFTGTLNQLVGNAAGVITAQPLPWTAIVDSVGFDEIDANGNLSGGKTYATAKLDPTVLEAGVTKHYNPDHVARKLGNTAANSAASWYGGKLAARNPYGIALRNGFFIGGFRGESTPGRANLAATPPAGTVRLNEIHVNPPSASDDSSEFIEVINPDGGIVGMSDLWVVIVAATAGDRGTIKNVLDLRGMSTGPNGLAIFADGIEGAGDEWEPFLHPLTLREDPESFNDDATQNGDYNFGETKFIEPNGGTAVLLVRGFTGALNQDLDGDNNGTFDTSPWSQIVDSISFGLAVDPAVPLLTFTGFSPGNLSRYNDGVFAEPPTAPANSAAEWYGGELEGPDTALTSTLYTANWMGSFKGGASPGRLNHSGTPNPAASVLLNELNINPPGGDNNREFIELTSTNRQSISTNGFTLLLLDVEGTDVGRILEAWTLDGLSTGSNGLLLTGSGYVSPTSLPWTDSDAIATATNIGSPAGMDFDDIGRATDNGATTVLLVKDFTGRVGDDLDSLDLGVLNNVKPWSALVDSIGMKEWDTTLLAHSGKVYGGVDLSQSLYTPDNVSRLLDNLTPLSVPAWYGGDIAGSTGTSVLYDAAQRFPSTFIGAVTPGHPNLTPNEFVDDLGDEDEDSVVNIIELALGMNINVPDAHKLPVTALVTVTGVQYPSISFTRLAGGVTTPPNKYTMSGLVYTVEFSTDCTTWSDGTQVFSTIAGDDPNLETATYRPSSAAFADGQFAGQMFLRLRVSRP